MKRSQRPAIRVYNETDIRPPDPMYRTFGKAAVARDRGRTPMGLRFQRRVRVLPGVRVNVGLRGVSTSVGVRGASLTVGKHGVHSNVGIPGTGLSYRSRIDGPAGARGSNRPAGTTAGDIPVQLKLSDNGAVEALDANGRPLPPRLVRALREQQGERIDAWLQQQCEAINAELAAITEIHLQCPSPDHEPTYVATRFTADPPQEPAAKSLGFLGRLFPGVRRRTEAENDTARDAWEQNMRQWRARKARFEHAEDARRKLFQQSRHGSAAEMSNFFQRQIEELTWPRETLIDFQIDDGGEVMFVDVDLPEIQDLPRKQAAVPSRGLRLSMKALSDAQNRRNYARHIHGVLFRTIGETFASLPRIQRVVGSAFSQRPESATGTIVDEYLISVSVDRRHWGRIDFSALERVDPVAALGQFNLRRRMTKTGIFTAIEPFAPPPSA